METLDFILPATNFQAVWPQIILVATALFVLLVDVFKRRERTAFIGFTSLVGTIIATGALLKTWPIANGTTFSGMIFTDGFSFFITLTVLIILMLTIMVSINSQKFFSHINCSEYYALVLFAACGMTLMASAGNLILIFVALETMSVSIYVLAGFHKNQLRSTESALKYFLLGAFASGFLLYGFALIFGATGTLDITKIGNFISNHPQILYSKLLIAGLVMMTVGFGFKISMVPFHMWTPDVYEGAPTAITGFMATGVKAAAFAALIRTILVPLIGLKGDWSMIMWIAAFLTMTVGNIIALAQDNIKRMLAYSSIAHAGYILIGFVASTRLAQAGMLFYLMAYAFMNIGAFGVVALLGKKEGEYNMISDFAGLGFKKPATGVLMSIFMFSLAGIPPTAGFMGKFYIFTEAMKAGYVWLVIFAAINSIISIYYYLRVVVVMYFHPSNADVVMSSPSRSIMLALAISGCGVLVMGIFPSYFWSFVNNCVFTLM